MKILTKQLFCKGSAEKLAFLNYYSSGVLAIQVFILPVLRNASPDTSTSNLKF